MAGLNNILPRLSQNFQNAITSILPQLQQWANTVSNVAIQIGDYLQPKLVALWNTIRESMPTFKQLYEEVLQPLAVAFGTTLVVALGLLVNAINVMMAVLTPAIQWMLENKATVVALATAFGILALAMNFNAIVAGFNGAMTGAIATINILRLTTIPNALLALSQFAGALVL